MQSFQGNRKYLEDRTTETLGLLFDMHWPYRQFATARGVRRSPFHDRLLALGACMTEAAGWERPGFFGAPGTRPEIGYSYGRQSWFDALRRGVPQHGRERDAVRPQLLHQVSGGGARCARRAQPRLRQ